MTHKERNTVRKDSYRVKRRMQGFGNEPPREARKTCNSSREKRIQLISAGRYPVVLIRPYLCKLILAAICLDFLKTAIAGLLVVPAFGAGAACLNSGYRSGKIDNG
jgi:hypothetical protein